MGIISLKEFIEAQTYPRQSHTLASWLAAWVVSLGWWWLPDGVCLALSDYTYSVTNPSGPEWLYERIQHEHTRNY